MREVTVPTGGFYDLIELNRVRLMYSIPDRMHFDDNGGVDYLCTVTSIRCESPVEVRHRFFGVGAGSKPSIYDVMHDLQKDAGWIMDSTQEDWLDDGGTAEGYQAASDRAAQLHRLLGDDFYRFLSEMVVAEGDDD